MEDRRKLQSFRGGRKAPCHFWPQNRPPPRALSPRGRTSGPSLPISMMPKVPNSLQQQRPHPPAQHFYLAAGGGEPISGRTSGRPRRRERLRQADGPGTEGARRVPLRGPARGVTTRRRRADERAGAAGPRSPSDRDSAHHHRAQR